MFPPRLRLTHPCSVLFMPLLLACGNAHGAGDGGSSDDAGRGDASSFDAGSFDAGSFDAGSFDAGSFDSGSFDAGPLDAGPSATCDAQDARAQICPDAVCDGPPTWHWDGERCLSIECGACVGADCASGASSPAECEAAHASCEPQLCRATGGDWLWWAEICGHYTCGWPPPELCLIGRPGCDCGIDQSFVPGSGCAPEPACPPVDPLPPDMLCTATGGRWDAICCDSVCGVPCGADCLDYACECGPMQVFHPERGCEVGRRCMERVEGERCEGEARCEGGTICCDSCGGAGCAGNPTCRFPVCDTDPAIDTCGNNSLAP